MVFRYKAGRFASLMVMVTLVGACGQSGIDRASDEELDDPEALEEAIEIALPLAPNTMESPLLEANEVMVPA